ncbi:unnamed protein product, partial [Discosporangium mesarthrocarpum]
PGPRSEIAHDGRGGGVGENREGLSSPRRSTSRQYDGEAGAGPQAARPTRSHRVRAPGARLAEEALDGMTGEPRWPRLGASIMAFVVSLAALYLSLSRCKNSRPRRRHRRSGRGVKIN